MNLGGALIMLGRRETGTDTLEKAAAAYREALKEDTRERVPLQFAYSEHGLANCLADLAERQKNAALMEDALAAMRAAADAYQQVGENYWLPKAEDRIKAMQAAADALKR